MPSPALLLRRLDDIARSLAARPDTHALLALGSVGAERERLDQFSDLDFFAVVDEAAKPAYLAEIDWLHDAHPVAWSFKNTKDGRKGLFADGVFCEYAVFTPAEMAGAHFAPGRLVWSRADFDRSLCAPKHLPPPRAAGDREWIVGELLSNLYVGLCRYRRGEKWTAMQFVQSHAAHRLAELVALADGGERPGGDPYSIDRRFEARHPEAERIFAECLPGYGRTPEAALAFLRFLDRIGEPVDPAIRGEIERLADSGTA
ncbi:MAG: hypothetical protein SF028_10850 [Candidatus Sumerlaeia bacterium]|nr:hypothetical protein [Candidatus Sumerlaeia bacterium]